MSVDLTLKKSKHPFRVSVHFRASCATFRFMLLMLTVVFLPEAPPVETRMTVDMNTTFGKIISQEEFEEDLGTTNIILENAQRTIGR